MPKVRNAPAEAPTELDPPRLITTRRRGTLPTADTFALGSLPELRGRPVGPDPEHYPDRVPQGWAVDGWARDTESPAATDAASARPSDASPARLANASLARLADASPARLADAPGCSSLAANARLERPAEPAGPTWLDAVKQYPRTGLWPVCNADHPYNHLVPAWERWGRPDEPAPTTLREAFGLERSEWSVQEDTYCFECGAVDDRSGELQITSTSADLDLIEWIGEHPAESWTPNSSRERVTLVPAARPADVVAELGWSGAMNRCMFGADALPILRSWEERFGAYVYSATGSTLTLLVARPPRALDEARLVAREHFHFCPYDTQFHGFAGIAPYVRRLIGAHLWHFLWD